MNAKGAGLFLLIPGAVLLMSVLMGAVKNAHENRQAAAASGAAMAQVRSRITLAREQRPAELPETDAPQMLVTESIDGRDYIGYLAIPELGMELPIQAELTMERLNAAPCLQCGSPLTDDAVIAAHNYPGHFGPLRRIVPGVAVIFTDMLGYSIEYTVSEVRTVNPDGADAVYGSGHALVLYTCTPGGAFRVAVYCDRMV